MSNDNSPSFSYPQVLMRPGASNPESAPTYIVKSGMNISTIPHINRATYQNFPISNLEHMKNFRCIKKSTYQNIPMHRKTWMHQQIDISGHINGLNARLGLTYPVFEKKIRLTKIPTFCRLTIQTLASNLHLSVVWCG
jgi:hypothetical protein